MSRRKPAATKFKAKPTPDLGHTPPLVTEPTPFQLFCEENGFTEKTVFISYSDIRNTEVKPFYFLFDSDTGGDCIYLKRILESGKIADNVILYPLRDLAIRNFSPMISKKPNKVEFIDVKFKQKGWDIYNDLFCYRWSEGSPVRIYKLVSSGSLESMIDETYLQLDPETGLFCQTPCDPNYYKFFDVYTLPSSSPSAFDHICATNGWDPNGVFTDSSGYRLVVQWDTGYNLIFFRRVDDVGNLLDEIYFYPVYTAGSAYEAYKLPVLPSILTQTQKEEVMSSSEPKATSPEKGEIPRKVKVDLSTVPVEVEGEPFTEGVLQGVLEGHRTPYLVEVEGLLIGFEKIQELGLTALKLRDLLRENPNMVWSYDKIKASNSWFSDINMHQCWLCYNYTGTESDVWEKA